MKYEKPAARDLTGLSSAAGQIPLACASGPIVDQDCHGGLTNVGPCTNGGTAGQSCLAGTTADVPTAPCQAGTGASECASGTWAGTE